jgi:hypothetical protein
VKEIVIKADDPERHNALRALLKSLFPECRIRLVTKGDLRKDPAGSPQR